jgi:radical SAM protein with 4Fe4S-binding SPASM domain
LESTTIIDDFLECCDIFEALPVIAVTGGDPMMNKDFFSILQMIKEKVGWSCLSVLGNPELLTVKMIKFLKHVDVKHYQLSLDGMKKIHDQIRHEGSFSLTCDKIVEMSEVGIPVYVMSTVSDTNYREMTQVMDLSYSLGAKHYMFARYIPEEGDCGIRPKEYMSFIKDILEKHKQYEVRGFKKLHKEPLISMCKGTEYFSKDKIAGGCGMGSSTISMLPDKTLMACRRHTGSILGKWTKKNNFSYHFLENPIMAGFREIEKIKGCNVCEYLTVCRGCRAAAYALSKDHFGIDPQCVLATKTIVDEGGNYV